MPTLHVEFEFDFLYLSQKSAFHPVAEHCTWCPWLETGDNESCNTSLADDSLDDSQSEGSSSPAAAWRWLLNLVQHPSSPAKDNGESLLDSSHSNGHTPVSYPIGTQSGQKRPDYFVDIFLAKAFYQKYLKEKCLSEYYQQLSFKYFVRIGFISKLFSEV